ncbi:hypothetical protein SLA2020_458560 [Shorea laevis]
MASKSTAAAGVILGMGVGQKPLILSGAKARTWIAVPNKRMRVKAMGMAKYKGTVMKEKQLEEMIEKKVMEAREVCEGNEISDECKVAWDEVEELSQAKADLRTKLEKQDPLEFYCQENPETDECRVYEN